MNKKRQMTRHSGKEIASLWGGGSSSFLIPAGESTIAAPAWSYPGEFKVKLNAAAGADYKLVVEPRGDSFVPGALLGPIGGAIDASTNENPRRVSDAGSGRSSEMKPSNPGKPSSDFGALEPIQSLSPASVTPGTGK